MSKIAVEAFLALRRYPQTEVTHTLIIQESAENYLETIYMLQKKNGNVRSIDIVGMLGLTKPSVSVAMKNLRENGYITMDAGTGFIQLTEKGTPIALKMYERHTLLSELLEGLGVDPETAAEDACRMEHVISAQTFEALKKHAHEFGNKIDQE